MYFSKHIQSDGFCVNLLITTHSMSPNDVTKLRMWNTSACILCSACFTVRFRIFSSESQNSSISRIWTGFYPWTALMSGVKVWRADNALWRCLSQMLLKHPPPPPLLLIRHPGNGDLIPDDACLIWRHHRGAVRDQALARRHLLNALCCIHLQTFAPDEWFCPHMSVSSRNKTMRTTFMVSFKK